MISGTTPGVESVEMDGFRFNNKNFISRLKSILLKLYHCSALSQSPYALLDAAFVSEVDTYVCDVGSKR